MRVWVTQSGKVLFTVDCSLALPSEGCLKRQIVRAYRPGAISIQPPFIDPQSTSWSRGGLCIFTFNHAKLSTTKVHGLYRSWPHQIDALVVAVSQI